eukprot:scaffold1309_cov117-Isochrysis_galbana.AAC.21
MGTRCGPARSAGRTPAPTSSPTRRSPSPSSPAVRACARGTGRLRCSEQPQGRCCGRSRTED